MAKKNKNDVKLKNTNYFKDMKNELKKVVLPTPKELLNNTVEVIAFVLIIAVIVFVLDLCFDGLNKYGISKVQDFVHSSIDKNVDNEENVINEDSSDSDINNDTTENQNVEAEVTIDNNSTDNKINE